MHKVISDHVMPLVGRVRFGEFHAERFGNVLSLQTKMIKHIQNKNADSLKKYLAFCIQEWPEIDHCPIDREIIGDAIKVIELS